MFFSILTFFSLCFLASSGSSEGSCYVPPSCLATEAYDKQTGFTNNTGYSVENTNECCQICLPGTPPTVCFDSNDEDCSKKTGAGDYDYLLFDQIWLPQFCFGLNAEKSHDPTLTHLYGSSCKSLSDSSSRLSIHGLWPNYYGGYPQCCNSTADMAPLVPDDVYAWTIWPRLKSEWTDPTASADCSACYMLNHEWQKHGNCYSPGNPLKYFEDALGINSLIAKNTDILNSYHGQTVKTADIASLYQKKVNVLCDNQDKITYDTITEQGTGMFVEIQTCWDNDRTSMVDCSPANNGTFTTPCPTFVKFRY